MSKRRALIILAIGMTFALVDSLSTNWLMARGATELNPIVAPIAGTPWLVIVKTGWVLVMGCLVLSVKDRRVGLRA